MGRDAHLFLQSPSQASSERELDHDYICTVKVIMVRDTHLILHNPSQASSERERDHVKICKVSNETN